ncbi:TetR/AcrR family transcriptional regulator [Amycolatopsis nigrescens]|uniref:TetR/AcrR family transcriptional regulator n=1 Tax=Amycolatopsis nigrescens TaxID=381445 RepID=UPI0007C4D47D|nr:TetR/AcrR family transcriptional regulator [Amycolatopsis nigrescens]
MSDSTTPEPESGETARTPVPRGARARERVLRAALGVLVDHGFSGFTMEAVADRARASKATIYRHWSSRADLLVAAVGLVPQPAAPPDTGELRADLIELSTAIEGLLARPSFAGLLAAFIDAAEREATLTRLHAEFSETRREPLRIVLTRARDRGELPDGTDLELAIDLLAAPAFYRRLITHRKFPPGYGVSVVDHVLTAIGYTGPR